MNVMDMNRTMRVPYISFKFKEITKPSTILYMRLITIYILHNQFNLNDSLNSPKEAVDEPVLTKSMISTRIMANDMYITNLLIVNAVEF